MKVVFTLLLVFFMTPLFSQKVDDTKIMITTDDTSDIYNRVKYSLVNSDFIVKDNGNKDTLTTYAREYSGIYCIARAIIKGNTITLTGAYGLKKMDDWGYTQAPKNYKRIVYYKGSKSWKLLQKVADKINGKITYGK